MGSGSFYKYSFFERERERGGGEWACTRVFFTVALHEIGGTQWHG